jgi:hypothetical protein
MTSVKLISETDAKALHDQGKTIWVTRDFEHGIKYSNDPLLSEITPNVVWAQHIGWLDKSDWGASMNMFFADDEEDVEELEL